MENSIIVYEGNNKTIKCQVQTDVEAFELTGYEAVMIVKKSKLDKDVDAKFILNGEIQAENIILFEINYLKNEIPADKYYYEINISKEGFRYTIVQDEYIVEDKIKDN